MTTDTHSETGEGNHSLADFTINRLHEALAIANKSADDQMFQKREAEAEVERLKGIKQIKVSRRPYDYECGDGCCSEYGETWSVDGVEVAHGPCDDNRLQQLLKHLGYDARIVNENEDGEEVCEL
jgi:hypothetical protein